MTVVSLLALSFITGVVVWWWQTIQAETMETPTWLHRFLVLHGSLNPLLCGVFGYLCCEHIRLGWQLRANLVTGLTMELIFAGLILSGVGLYYAGSPTSRDLLAWTHRFLGMLLPVGLGAHWLAGIRWAKRIRDSSCA